MENKCLVTKLKTTVDNPLLPKLGQFTFEVDNTDGKAATLYIGWGSKIEVLGDGYMIISGEHLRELSPTSYNTAITFPQMKVTLAVTAKYTDYYQVYFQRGYNFDPSIFKYRLNSDSINMWDNPIPFDISYLKNHYLGNNFRFGPCAYGDLSNLTGLRYYTKNYTHTVDLKQNTKITGEIDNFASVNLATFGKEGEDIQLRVVSNGIVTLNGEIVPNNTTKIITYHGFDSYDIS